MTPTHGYADFFKEKRKIYFVSAIILLLLVVCIWWWRFHVYPYESTDDASIDGVEVSVSPEVGGKIVQLFVDEGDHVHTGDPLFAIDETILKAQREKARAAISNAADQANLQRVKVSLALQDYQRAKREFDEGVISPEAIDHSQKALEAAKAELQAMYSLMAMQTAQMRLVEAQIAKCTVAAPCEGVIAKRWHFPGDVVRDGQAVFSLFDLSNIWVTANLEETKLGRVQINDPVNISVDAYPHLDFEGNVLIVGAGAASQFSLIPPNNASGNFTKVTQRVPIRISLKDPNKGKTLYLRPGMSVEVQIKVR